MSLFSFHFLHFLSYLDPFWFPDFPEFPSFQTAPGITGARSIYFNPSFVLRFSDFQGPLKCPKRQDSTGFMCISAISGHGPGPQDGPAPASESTGSQKYHYDSSHHFIISMISYCSNFLKNPDFHSYNFPRQTRA